MQISGDVISIASNVVFALQLSDVTLLRFPRQVSLNGSVSV